MSRPVATGSGARIHGAHYVSASEPTSIRQIVAHFGLRRFALESAACAIPFVLLALIWIGTPA